jgi:hypothetical protein
MVLTRGSRARGSLTLPRMNAHRLVIAAAALTVAVAAALAVALATFSGQALPHAVRHDLAVASGTSLALEGATDAGQAAQYTAVLPAQISRALEGTAFAFYRADWSDPLGFVPGSRPAAPPSAGNQPIAEAAALDGLTAHAALVSGSWPGAPAAGQPIPAALPATAAALLRVRVGDVLRMRDRISNATIRFVVTGLYRPRQVSSEYWELDEIALSGSSTTGGFTTYGPLTVQAAAFAGALPVSGGTWLAQPAVPSIPAGQLTTVAANVNELAQELQNAQSLPSLAVTTSLPAVLDGTATDLDVARSLLAICAILLALLAAAALLAVARLLSAQREIESAMLTARGATRGQLIRLTAAEAVPVCVIAAAAGGLLGAVLARLLALGGGPGLGSAAALAARAAAVVAAVALVIMLVPALTTVSPGTARARRGRQAAVSTLTRAGADLAVVLLAVLACWQLRHYSVVSAGANGNFGVDPVVVVAPALALLGGTVVALRLLPAGGRAGDRLAARGRRLTAALASWQISRQPLRQGGAALLIVLAVATGTLVLAQRQSWTTSEHDQATFGTGADVLVETTQPLTAAQAGALVRTPGVQHAMPVATFTQYATNGQALAVDAGQAADVTLLRADQSARPVAALFSTIRPSGPAPGVTLPGHLAEVALTARLGPASLGLAPGIVNVSVQDADGDVYLAQAGTLPADGRDHTLTVGLTSGAGGAAGTAVYPLRLTAVTVDYTLPATRPRAAATFTVDGLSGGPGTAQLPGKELAGWTAIASSGELVGVRETTGASGPSGLPAASSRAARGRAEVFAFGSGYGLAPSGVPGVPPSPVDGQLALTAAAPGTVLPGIATRGFLAATSASVGSTVQADFNGEVIAVRIVAEVATFPTVSASGGGLIVDLAALQQLLTSDSIEPAPVTQWWLATAGQRTPPGLAASLPPGSAVTSAAATEAALSGDPLSELPQRALLAVAIAAVVLAITGFCVSIAAGVHQRRAENALLAALGVPPRAAAGQLCLEKLMLSLPSALAGLVLGVILAELLVPAITLTAAATTPVPPVLIQFPWAQTLLLTLAVAVIPVLAAAVTVARRPDAAAELRAAEAG